MPGTMLTKNSVVSGIQKNLFLQRFAALAMSLKQMREDMAKFYKSSDFLIVSLIDEPIFSATVPAKTQTYIAAKKPILAIINGDVSDIVSDNNLGICVDPSNVDLIKETFEKCIDMPDSEKYKFILNNTKLLESTFNKDSIINNLTKQLTGFKN